MTFFLQAISFSLFKKNVSYGISFLFFKILNNYLIWYSHTLQTCSWALKRNQKSSEFCNNALLLVLKLDVDN